MLTLVDTGPLVAILDRGDPWHSLVRERWSSISGQWVTTGAVITEAMHFLNPIPGGPRELLRFLQDAGVVVEDSFSRGLLAQAVSLMEKYADTPMDFADATLVVLAGELKADPVLTLDERGFRTYRHGRNRPFRLVLQEESR